MHNKTVTRSSAVAVIADRTPAVRSAEKTILSVISILTLFIVIAAFRPVNRPENVSTGAVVRAE